MSEVFGVLIFLAGFAAIMVITLFCINRIICGPINNSNKTDLNNFLK